MDLSIEVVEKEEKNVVQLAGEIDVYTASQLKDILIPLTEKENNYIEVDFTNVNYMDSTGLGIFINALKSCNEHESDMKLIHLSDRILRLFKITGLDEIINIKPETRGAKE